jgi:23S rRNA maturation-related 3'-5' exoribonuclease YhaM
MKTIIEKAKAKFLEMVDSFGSDPYYLLPHVPEAEKWAKFMLRKYPQANEEIVLLSVWLHDIGHYPLPTEIDHAVRGEERAREFLKQEKYDSKKMEEVLHCVRAHRSRDVMPKSLEAKIIAFVDSASHMTDPMYFYMSKQDKENNEEFKAYAKMERDMRDLSAFPEVQNELIGLYDAWKNLIKEYEKINLV